MSLPMTFTVLSSWGEFVAESETGQIIEKRLSDHDPKEDPDSTEYYEILKAANRFDVEEWRKTYPGEVLNTQCDILDLGIFYGENKYDPPCQAWREEFKASRK